MYRLYSNNIELIDINSVTEQEMQSFANKFFKSMWTNWHTHTFVHTLIKEALKGTPPFLCYEFSGVHCPTCCRYILQSQHGHCKDTHFLIFLLKIHKDCDYCWVQDPISLVQEIKWILWHVWRNGSQFFSSMEASCKVDRENFRLQEL